MIFVSLAFSRPPAEAVRPRTLGYCITWYARLPSPTPTLAFAITRKPTPEVVEVALVVRRTAEGEKQVAAIK